MQQPVHLPTGRDQDLFTTRWHFNPLQFHSSHSLFSSFPSALTLSHQSSTTGTGTKRGSFQKKYMLSFWVSSSSSSSVWDWCMCQVKQKKQWYHLCKAERQMAGLWHAKKKTASPPSHVFSIFFPFHFGLPKVLTWGPVRPRWSLAIHCRARDINQMWSRKRKAEGGEGALLSHHDFSNPPPWTLNLSQSEPSSPSKLLPCVPQEKCAVQKHVQTNIYKIQM